MVNQRPNGGFGPKQRVCKLTKEKSKSNIMKKSLREVMMTRQHYSVPMSKGHINVNIQKDKGKAHKKMQFSLQMSRHRHANCFSSLKKKKCESSFARNTRPKTFESPIYDSSTLDKTEKSRTFSLGNNGMMSLAKDAVKSMLREKNIISRVNNVEKSRSLQFSDGLLPLKKDKSNSTFTVLMKCPPLMVDMPSHMIENVGASDQGHNLGSMSRGLLDQGKAIADENVLEGTDFSKRKVVSTSIGVTLIDENKCYRDRRFIDKANGGQVCTEDHCKAIKALNSSLALKNSQGQQDDQHISSSDSFPMSKKLSSHRLIEESSKVCNDLDRKKQNTNLVKEDIIRDNELKRRRLVRKYAIHDDENSEYGKDDGYGKEVKNCRPTKMKYIDNEYGKDNGYDQNLAAVEVFTAGPTTHNVIDKPIWSGIFKIGRKTYVPVAAYSSPNSCKKLLDFSRCLQPVVEIAKLSRWDACPKGFLSSEPINDNNALYFLPLEMRPNGDMDGLIKEVMENDIVLQVVVGDAEMTIFPSILLPEQSQTFKCKSYLCGVLMPIEKVISSAHGEEMQQHHADFVEGGDIFAGRQHSEEGPTHLTPAPAAMPVNHEQMNSSLEFPTGSMFAFVAGETPRARELIEEFQRDGGLIVTMGREAIGSSCESVGRRNSSHHGAR